MKILKNPEVRGIATLILIIFVVAGAMAATSGKLEQWFGITLFSGPQALDKIVFVSEKDGSADVYLMNTDGTEAKRLTRNATPQSVPAISTTANRVLFVADAGGTSQVFSVGVKGGRPEQITTATGPKAEPAYSPNGKNLSFIASGKVYVAALDGNKLDPILPTPEEVKESMVSVEGNRGTLTLYSTYAWGPDGVSVAGVTNDGNGNDTLVYLKDTNSKPVRVAFAPPGKRAHVTHISWASQKPVLAISVIVGKEGILQLFDAEVAAGGQSNPVATLVRAPGIEFGKPALSPDGTKIMLPADEKKQSGLVLIDLNGGQMTPLTMGKFENLVFSPKGDKVLATRVGENDERNVVVIDASTGEVTDLTTDGKSYNAIWTPVSEK